MRVNRKSFVLDSYALLSYLGNERGKQRITELLRDAQKGKIYLLLCTINLGEILYITERRRGLASAQNIQSAIETLPIKNIEATRNLVLDAAHIKANYALSYADAFVVAVAQQQNGIILTGDPEFRAVEDFVDVEWLP